MTAARTSYWLALVAVIALASLLTGCGGGDEPLDERKDTQPVVCATYIASNPECRP